MMRHLRVRFHDGTPDVLALVGDADTFDAVARQVRAAKGWAPEQCVRFLCAGRELFLDDGVAKAAATVHCIASDGGARYSTAAKSGGNKPGEQAHSPAIDWLEVVDPGTVLMWIFGTILVLLWLLFVFYAHMFDKTSVVMLCMMSLAYLVPCILSYVPCMLSSASSSIPLVRQPLLFYGAAAQQHVQQPLQPQQRPAAQQQQQPAAQQQLAGGGSSARSWPGYAGSIPPRPAARVRPGAAAPHA